MIAVPGEVKGLYAAHQKYGKLKWKDLIQPTIDLCENGFRMTLRLHQTATFPLSCLREKAVLRYIHSLFINTANACNSARSTITKRALN